jgi:hypothetical protein
MPPEYSDLTHLAPEERRISWRDVLAIHPAAEFFPLMSPNELKALGEDIRKHGLRIPTIWWRDPTTRQLFLLDGRNRLDALEKIGRNIVNGCDGTRGDADLREILRLSEYWHVLPPCGPRGANYPDPYHYVISANIHRRHLTPEDKRKLIAKLIKATPEKSDRQIAETVKADHKTVGAVRAEQESRGGKFPTSRRARTARAASSRRSARSTSPTSTPMITAMGSSTSTRRAEGLNAIPGSGSRTPSRPKLPPAISIPRC